MRRPIQIAAAVAVAMLLLTLLASGLLTWTTRRWAGRMLADAAAGRERGRGGVPRRHLTRLAS